MVEGANAPTLDTAVVLTEQYRAVTVLVADVNADGVLDIVVGNGFGGNVSVLLGIDGTGYEPRVNYSAGDGPRHVRVADFTGDGVPDVVVTNAFSDDVSLLVGQGDGTFAGDIRFAVNDLPLDGAAFDANGDGALDFVVVNSNAQNITPLLNECDTAAPCPADLDGDGELTRFDFLAFQNLFDAGDPLADFDGDGSLTIFDFLAFQNAFDAGC